MDSTSYGTLIFCFKTDLYAQIKRVKMQWEPKVTDNCVMKSCLTKEKARKVMLETEENRLDDQTTAPIPRYVFLIKAAIPNVQHNIHHCIYQPLCQVLFASAVAKIRPGCAHIILIILKGADL